MLSTEVPVFPDTGFNVASKSLQPRGEIMCGHVCKSGDALAHQWIEIGCRVAPISTEKTVRIGARLRE